MRLWSIDICFPRLLTLGAALVLLSACATLPPPRPGGCPPRVLGVQTNSGGDSTARISILTYNVEGVPYRTGRAADLTRIGEQLSQLCRSNAPPDIVLIQEMFSRDALAAIERAAYPFMAAGPARDQRRRLPALGARPDTRWRKGEIGIRLVGSGLAIGSVFPIEASASEPFSGLACAGFDCLSNKGAQIARLRLPGAPGFLDIVNTHMNAQGASRVAPRRHLPVHNAQVLELTDFMTAHAAGDDPVVLGGDFNMRGSEARFDVFQATQPLTLVHQACLADPEDCEAPASWDGDAPWMDTQDLQLFQSGRLVTIRPVRVEALFDGRPGSPALSDHDGLLVTYELRWREMPGR